MLKNYYNFQDDNSRALSQAQGISKHRAMQLTRSHIYEAGPRVGKRCEWRVAGNGIKEKGRYQMIQNPVGHCKEFGLGRNVVLIFT